MFYMCYTVSIGIYIVNYVDGLFDPVRQDIGWSRSRVPILRWSCKLWINIKHTIVYLDSDPYYELIALRPMFFIKKEEQCYKEGELRAQNIL
jgi:hypothetical protein